MRRHFVLVAAAVITMAGAIAIGQGQAPSPEANPSFEVASVKPNKSGDGRIMLGVQPGGRFTATNVTLRLLIGNAYQLQDFRIVGGPSWLTSDRFDIVAKAPEGVQVAPLGPGQGPGPIQLMIRALLAERFKLTAHNESRETPLYALVMARADKRFGPQLKPAAVDCAALMAARRGGPPPGGPGGPGGDARRGGPGPGAPPPPGGGGGPAGGFDGRMQCGIRIGPGNLAAGSVPMSQIANTLSIFANRIVVDKTGLTGNYDVELQWTPDQMPQGLRGDPPPGAPSLPPIDPNGPSIFTAVQEQLGLKLDAQKGPVDVLVIDRVEPPTED